MLTALGASGGAVVSALLGSPWRKPMVRAVVLPAHAETSPVAGCSVSVSAAVLPVDAVAYSASVFVGTKVLAMTATSGVSTLFAGSSSFPPGIYSAGLSVQQGTTQSVSWSVTFSCCNHSTSVSSPETASDFSAEVPVHVIGDDGECEFLLYSAGP
ncbi:MAG: hypothetical protein WB783_13395 [Arenicellales bacterium]